MAKTCINQHVLVFGLSQMRICSKLLQSYFTEEPCSEPTNMEWGAPFSDQLALGPQKCPSPWIGQHRGIGAWTSDDPQWLGPSAVYEYDGPNAIVGSGQFRQFRCCDSRQWTFGKMWFTPIVMTPKWLFDYSPFLGWKSPMECLSNVVFETRCRETITLPICSETCAPWGSEGTVSRPKWVCSWPTWCCNGRPWVIFSSPPI